ncbi:hypothetical protein LXL04_004820 [Taraxacum kok-saghyz]
MFIEERRSKNLSRSALDTYEMSRTLSLDFSTKIGNQIKSSREGRAKSTWTSKPASRTPTMDTKASNVASRSIFQRLSNHSVSSASQAASQAVKKGWKIYRFDVAFLHGDLHEQVYMKIPHGLDVDSTTDFGVVWQTFNSFKVLRLYSFCISDHSLFCAIECEVGNASKKAEIVKLENLKLIQNRVGLEIESVFMQDFNLVKSELDLACETEKCCTSS